MQQNDNSDYLLVVRLWSIFFFVLYFYKCLQWIYADYTMKKKKAYENIKNISGNEQKLLLYSFFWLLPPITSQPSYTPRVLLF